MAFAAFVAELARLGLPLGRPHMGERCDLPWRSCCVDQAEGGGGDLDLLLQLVWPSRGMTERVVKKRGPRRVGASGNDPRRAERGGRVTQGLEMASDQSN